MHYFNHVDCIEQKSQIDCLQHWVVPSNDNTWSVIKKEWEEHHSKKWLLGMKDKRFVIQAGGSIGLYPRLLSDIFEMVYTFEPNGLSFYCLSHNCQKDNIIKMQAALGE